jgi:hypothetical protein
MESLRCALRKHEGIPFLRRHGMVRAHPSFLLLFSGAVISVFLPMSALAHPPTFATRVDYSNAGGLAIATADVTGDGILDLITVGWSIYGFKVLPGNGSNGVGDGTFGTPVNYTSGFGTGLATGQNDVITGDFDNDGRIDVAVVNKQTENVSIAINNGSGFNTAVNYPLFASSNPRAITTGNFNNDSALDLAIADFGDPSDHTTDHWISVLLGSTTTPGTFLPEVKYDAGESLPFGEAPADIVVADFNGDGITDLAVAGTGGDNTSVFLGNGSGGHGDGTFQTGVHYGYVSGQCISQVSIDAGNLNADGQVDIVMGCGTTLNAEVLLNQGSGTFPPAGSPLIALYPTSQKVANISLGDLNGDGNLDMVTAVANTGDGSGSKIEVFEGNGDGTFKTRTDYSVGADNAYPAGLVIADFNGDGLNDIATANLVANTISVFLNTTVLTPPAPTLTYIVPSSAGVGGAAFVLTVTGTNFVGDSIIQWNGAPLATAYVSPTQLTATVLASDLTSEGNASITVFTPSPGGGTSNAINFPVLLNIPILSGAGLVALMVILLLGGSVVARGWHSA